jgi:hypothetical protein
MKIAAITDDGQTISQHFGRAAYYLVAIVEDGKVIDRQMRDKPGRSRFVAPALAGVGIGFRRTNDLVRIGRCADRRPGA